MSALEQRWRDRRDSFRQRGDRFDPSAFRVEVISGDRTARAFVEQHHYSGSYPAARCRVGLYREQAGWFRPELVGVAVFSVPMAQSVIPKWAGVQAAEGVELGRFVLLDEVGFNGESWFLARALRALHAEIPTVRAVVSFSDPLPRQTSAGIVVTPGHVGTIYQALNASYRGRTEGRSHYMTAEGRFLSPRAISKIRGGEAGWEYATRDLTASGAPPRLPGEEPAAWLARVLPLFSRVAHPGNHAYTWTIGARGRIGAPPSVLPYPRRAA
jgi:hypothetical protein